MLYNIYSNIYFVSDCCGKVFRLILACLQHRRRVSKQICANERNGKPGREVEGGEGGKWRSAKSTIEASTERELEPSQAEASSSPGTGGILRASLVQQAGANLTTAGRRREKGA